MEKTFVLPLKNVRRHHHKLAGGKGANLGELSEKFRVPDGVIVTTDSFREFIEHNKIDSLIRDIKKGQGGEKATLLRGKILSSEMPKHVQEKIESKVLSFEQNFLAVRSSAIFEDSSQSSWAGQLETYTNVNKENAVQHVKKCWASLFSERAIDYSLQKNMLNLEMAVIIQEMLNPETSGVCFTANPVTNNEKELIIEAGFGLGESIVSGKITPDTYIVDKESLKITKIDVNEQKRMVKFSNGKSVELAVPDEKCLAQKLEETKILELAKNAIEIEKHYNSPQDIEWAFEKGKLYILQSRPITTLQKESP